MTTPAIIKRYREENGLSQQGLALLLGVDQATVSRIERGFKPSKPVSLLLSQVLSGPPPTPQPEKERVAS